jgi:superfamily II DNA helicase RecQ
MGLLSWVRYRHSLVIAPTGSGKTRLMFMNMRWCLLDGPNAILLLISPTKILGKTQHALLAPDITSVWWDADSYTSQEKQQLSAEHFRLIVLSTESACSPWFKKIGKTHLKGVLVDEAHLALVWDFREWTWICELLRDTIKLMVLTGTLRNTSETKLLKVFGLHASLANIIRVPIARYTLYSELCKRPGPSLTVARHPLYYFNPVVDQLCITGAGYLVIFTRSVFGALQIFHYYQVEG